MTLVFHLQLWVFFFPLYGFGFLIHLFFPFRLLFQTSLSWWLKKPSWRLNTGKVSSPNNISAVHCVFIMMVPWIAMIRKHNQSGPQPGKCGHDRPLFSFCRNGSVRQWCVLPGRDSISIAWETDPVPAFVCPYRDVVPHVAYTYQVQTVSGRSESEPSPPLVHELGAPYCGDGCIQRWEETTVHACADILRNKMLNPSTPPPQQLQRWGVRWYEHCEWGWLLQPVQERALLQLHRWVFGCFIYINSTFFYCKGIHFQATQLWFLTSLLLWIKWPRWRFFRFVSNAGVRPRFHERMQSTSGGQLRKQSGSHFA